VTLHTSRIYVGRDVVFRNDDEFEQLVRLLDGALPRAIEDVWVCQPDHVIVGLSSESFWGGKAGAEAYIKLVEERSGTTATTAGNAVPAGLRALGVRRVGVITPYQAVADAQVRGFLEESGFDVAAIKGLRLQTGVQIAAQTEDTLREALSEVNVDGVEALLQVGTNLPMARLVDGFERHFGKPVFSINATLLWHALRTNGITDSVPGYGALLRDH
jgi:maleate isomerase